MPQISHRLPRLRLLNSTSEKKHSWENPEASIGDFCRSMGRSQCWHAQGPARDLFIQLADEIKTYLDRNCEPPSRELHWSLYMIGRSKSTARPVLMFICEDSNSRKIARKTVKESGILLRYPGVDIADCSHSPDLRQLVQLGSGEHKDNLIMQQAAPVFYRPTDSILGSQIFAKNSNGINLTSRKATAGAVVNFGDKICFLTAAHGFETRWPPSDPYSSFEYDIDGESDANDEDSIEAIRQGSCSPLSKHSDWSLGEPEFLVSVSSSSHNSELGIGNTGLVLATDPIATVETASEKHGSFQQPIGGHLRHRASTLTEASLKSGTLLTTSAQGSQPGLDYALIETEAWDLKTPNQIFLNRSQSNTLNPTQISDSGPKDAEIVAMTGSSGFLNGRLLGTPSFSRAPGQPSQEVWTVKFDGRLEDGDCGTCVFDAQTGDMYGHVVAGNPGSGYAYIIPAYQIRDDLLRRFGKDLQLHKPSTHAWYWQTSIRPDLRLDQNNESQSKGSPWVPSHTTSDDQYKPLPSETHQSLTTNRGRRRLRQHLERVYVEKERDYFTPGRIFLTHWSENAPPSSQAGSGNSDIIVLSNGNRIISSTRRMVVIGTIPGQNSFTCVGQGLSKPGLDLRNHAVAFDENNEPFTSVREPPIEREPLAVSLVPLERLDPMSRINFGALHTVELNTKICDIGHIADSSMDNFNSYVAEALRTIRSGLGSGLDLGEGQGENSQRSFDASGKSLS